MVKKKGKSKRQTLKQKYKIERRVKEHKRKTKKETRRRCVLWYGGSVYASIMQFLTRVSFPFHAGPSWACRRRASGRGKRR